MNVLHAAGLLGVTPSTVRNQLEKRVLRGTKPGRFWDVSPEEVERYERDHRGKHTGQIAALLRVRADPVLNARRLAAVGSAETRAKIGAAKRGRRLSPEHRAKIGAGLLGKSLSEAHRDAIRDAQKGKTLAPGHLERLRITARTPESRAAKSARQKAAGRSPAQIAALARWNAQKRGPMSVEHRDAISQGQVRAYLEGRRKYNSWEVRAAEMLLPLGYERFPRYGGHAFDFGNASTLVEVNSCRYHDHRAIKATCRTIAKPGSFEADERARAIAREAGLRLVELWSCETRRWARLIGIPADSA